METPAYVPACARTYHQAGWHPLELPAQAKSPPPEGRTGFEGKDMTAEEVAAAVWTGNIGVRMPVDVIGLDVDAYRGGNDTFKALVARLGKLPNTWISHSNRNDDSGIRFFRVPVGMVWIAALPGIEIIQRGHRFAVVWPSLHPEGRPYGWWDQAEGGPTTDVPLVEDLPELPWKWIAELSRANQVDLTANGAVPRAAEPEVVDVFKVTHRQSDNPGYLSGSILHYFGERWAQGYSRHDTMQHCLIWAMECVRAGVVSGDAAVRSMGATWVNSVAPDARRSELFSTRRTTEFDAMLRHAVGKALAKPEADIVRLHDQVAGIAIGAPVVDVEQDRPDVFINWSVFSKRDSVPRQWLIEAFWPAGRAMALWANAKEGKSELALWCVGNLAMGVHPWTATPVPPVDIAYFDFEMTEDDLEERLDQFGFDPDRLGRLHYALLPPIHALDTETGGQEVAALAQSVAAQAVVIDTFTGAVGGEENSADTVRDFTRHTGLVLKRAGIAYLRTDHAGKGKDSAPRGTSAKQQDVDVTWRLRRTQAGVELNCGQATRLSWVGPTLAIDRVADQATGLVRYSAPITLGWPAGTTEKAAALDKIGFPLDGGRPAAKVALKAAGLVPGRDSVLAAALRYRSEQAGNSSKAPFLGNSSPADGNMPTDLFSDQQ